MSTLSSLTLLLVCTEQFLLLNLNPVMFKSDENETEDIGYFENYSVQDKTVGELSAWR